MIKLKEILNKKSDILDKAETHLTKDEFQSFCDVHAEYIHYLQLILKRKIKNET